MRLQEIPDMTQDPSSADLTAMNNVSTGSIEDIHRDGFETQTLIQTSNNGNALDGFATNDTDVMLGSDIGDEAWEQMLAGVQWDSPWGLPQENNVANNSSPQGNTGFYGNR